MVKIKYIILRLNALSKLQEARSISPKEASRRPPGGQLLDLHSYALGLSIH